MGWHGILLYEADPNLETEQGQRPLSLVKASYLDPELSRPGSMVFWLFPETTYFGIFLLGFHLQ